MNGVASDETSATVSDERVSVIIPTLNEAASLPRLVPRVAAALAGRAFEIVVVDDDSADGTVEACAELSRQFPLRLIVRRDRRDGLSGAVLEGFARATGDVLVVMDADLQHPPEKIPGLLAALETPGVEFALGSRYAPGGSVAERWSVARRVNSWIATALARPFAGAVRDPMSGFFAIPRRVFERGAHLTPLGYKIALELMCKCRVTRVQEVPIHFASREAGASKLTVAQQFRYLEHLSRLYDFCFPRASPIAKFAIVTAVTWTLAAAVYALLVSAGAVLPVATVLAYGVSVLATAAFHYRYVRTQRAFLLSNHPWRDFWIAAAGELSACAAVASYLWWRLDIPGAAELFMLPFVAGLFARYVLRKELLLDVRGLRREHEPRREEMTSR